MASGKASPMPARLVEGKTKILLELQMEAVIQHQSKDALQMSFQQKEGASKLAQVLPLSSVEISSPPFGIHLSVLSVKLEFGQTSHMSVKLVPTITLTLTMTEFKLGLVLLANKTKSLQKRKVV